MHYVYLLRSQKDPSQTYGYTNDLKSRLNKHNTGGSIHTSKFIPWELENYFAFSDKGKALHFEKYLKSHSGKAFVVFRGQYESAGKNQYEVVDESSIQ